MRAPETTPPRPNRLARKTWRLFNADEAVASQHGNVDAARLNTCVEQAFSLWSAVARLQFAPIATGTPDVPITFSHLGESAAELGNGTVEINIDRDFFIDPFTATDPHPTQPGPHDIIGTLAHEIGHHLGLEHPPEGFTEPALMTPSQGDAVRRRLYAYDIDNIQAKHGAIRLSGERAAALDQAVITDTTHNLTFVPRAYALIVGGPDGATAAVEAPIAADGALLNSIRLDFTCISRNVTVERMQLVDDTGALEIYYLSARASGNEGLAGKRFEFRFGAIRRPTIHGTLRARFALHFQERDEGSNGVVMFEHIVAELIPAEPVFA